MTIYYVHKGLEVCLVFSGNRQLLKESGPAVIACGHFNKKMS